MGRKPEGKAEKAFKNLGKRIDLLMKDLQDLKSKTREEYSESFENFDRKTEKVKEDFSEFQERNKGKWEEIEKHLENAGGELKKAFSSAFKNKDNEKR